MRNTNFNSYGNVPPKSISWKAIFAGTVFALSVMIILNLIGLAIGLWSIEPTEENNPLSGLGTGSIIWWVFSNLLVLFTGGCVAARVGVSLTNISGIMQGIMTWAMYTLFSAWLVTSVVGSIVSGVGNVVGGVLSSTGEVVADQVGPMINDQFKNLELSLDDAQKEFYALLEDTGKKKLDPQYLESQADKSANDAKNIAIQPGGADAKVNGIFSKTKNRFEQSFEAIDKEALVNVLVERTDMTRSEAQRAVENNMAEFERARQEFEAFLQETKEKAKEKAEKVAKAVGDAAMYLAIALILGAIAAAFGGYMGVKRLRDEILENDYLEDESDTIETTR